jgi:hypothetical protein
MTKKRRSTFVLVVAGLAVCMIVLFAGGIAWFFTSALERSQLDAAAADVSIEQVRGKFRGTEPVMLMQEDRPVLARQPPTAPPERVLESLHMMGWDPDRQVLAHVTLPFWLVRMKPGNINLSASSAVPNVRVSLTVKELERYGPALVLDHTGDDGAHVLIWTE